MSKSHPDLVPYLQKHSLSWEEFARTPRGRPKKGDIRAAVVRTLKADLITDLHSQGMTWNEMCELTGKTIGFIQKYTRAMWNPKSRQNSRDNANRTARSRKGEKKPWLTDQMTLAWDQGKFDFHRGRKRTSTEIDALKAGWTPDVRAAFSRAKKELWQVPEYRNKLLTFHRSPEERARRSKAQSDRMATDPVKWTRGRGKYVTSQKADKCRFWVRSSYEVVAVALLEGDPNVKSYIYEKPYILSDGKIGIPDFLVCYTDGSVVVVEVKASWVLTHPDMKQTQERLRMYEQVAESNGYGFQIWTEQDVLNDTIATA